jgi:hypothetical protein
LRHFDQALADAVASETNQSVLCALADEAGGVLRTSTHYEFSLLNQR